jgi:hypothetical protein
VPLRKASSSYRKFFYCGNGSGILSQVRAIRCRGVWPRAKDRRASRFSGSYPLPAMRKLALISKAALENLEISDDLRPSYLPPKWVLELATSLEFKVDVKYNFSRENHINVNEQLAYGTLVKHVALRHPDSRAVTLQDSRVVLGANAKGRSSSAS